MSFDFKNLNHLENFSVIYPLMQLQKLFYIAEQKYYQGFPCYLTKKNKYDNINSPSIPEPQTSRSTVI